MKQESGVRLQNLSLYLDSAQVILQVRKRIRQTTASLIIISRQNPVVTFSRTKSANGANLDTSLGDQIEAGNCS